MVARSDGPAEVVERVRTICALLPEVHEEPAWVGTRWRIRTRTFAHVLDVDEGWPPAYATAAGTDGPVTLLMFRSSGPELEALRSGGTPFFPVVWRPDEVGLLVDGEVDWEEVRELLVESYRLLAPARLAAELEPPDA